MDSFFHRALSENHLVFERGLMRLEGSGHLLKNASTTGGTFKEIRYALKQFSDIFRRVSKNLL